MEVFSESLTRFINTYMNDDREVFSAKKELLISLLSNEPMQERPKEFDVSVLLDDE